MSKHKPNSSLMASISLLIIAFATLDASTSATYQPNWASIDSRPLPPWYDEAKIGIFLHWGVFSVPSFGSEWFWNFWNAKHPAYVEFMKNNFRPDFAYADFASEFNAELFRPDDWAELFKKSGAKYVVLTSKHHEGFTNWPSKHSFNWNSMAVGPKRDLVGELADAIRNKTNLRFGLYHSWFEWFNPIYLQDATNKFRTNEFVKYKSFPELLELVTRYKPELIWSDGDAGPDWYWNSTVFLAWLYNESPVRETVVVNDRWGSGTSCKHGGYWNCADRYRPSSVVNHKWESAFTLDKSSWGYNRLSPLSQYLSIDELLFQIVSTVAYGGNALINAGPTADGRIQPIFQERFLQMGRWLGINGDAIYGTKVCHAHQNDSYTKDVYYTCSKDDKFTYATFFRLPTDGLLTLGSIRACPCSSALLGTSGQIRCEVAGGSIKLHLKDIFGEILVNSLTSAWTVKLGACS